MMTPLASRAWCAWCGQDVPADQHTCSAACWRELRKDLEREAIDRSHAAAAERFEAMKAVR